MLATFVVYYNAVSVPFFFDDRPAIERNESIRQLWPLRGPLSPPTTSAGAAGRPIVNLSLAVNHALGALEPSGYHLFNIVAHAVTGLALWSFLRRTLSRTPLHPSADGLALASALLWLVHPLQTETVVCVVQRNEILVALFLILTLDCLARAADSPRAGLWGALAVAACLLGMASKEVMVVAPLLALLYDRTFLGGTFAQTWRQRWRLHVALATTWLLLAALVLANDQRAGTAGFGLGVSTWSYLLTQCDALTTYLKLVVWPHPLVADYGFDLIATLRDVPGRAALIAILLATTACALRWRPMPGFGGAAFFALLAPSSSIVPLTTQPIAEHRMYLPLAAVITLAVIAMHLAVRCARLPLLAGLLVACGLLTARRTAAYASEEYLWTDTIAKVPGNPRAYASRAGTRARQSQWEQAVADYETAVRLRPDYADAHNDLASALGKLGRHEQALTHQEQAWRLKPDDLDVRFNLGLALLQSGRAERAIPHLEAVLDRQPGRAAALVHLGDALRRSGRPQAALDRYEQALRLQPAHPDLRASYGEALEQSGRPAEAAAQYSAALRLRPDWAELHYNLGNIRLRLGQNTSAAESLTSAVRLRPGWVPAHHNLALALARLGRVAEAVPHYEEILRQQPASAQAHHNLALALAASGRTADAIAQDEAALRLQPDFAPSRRHLQQLRGR